MSFDLNDPRLTEYALGEMDEKDAAFLETQLDAAAHAEVESIRAMAAAVEADFAGEAGSELTAAQRTAIASQAKRRQRGIPYWVVPLAASLLVCLSAYLYFGTQARAYRDQVDLEGESYHGLDRDDLLTRDSVTAVFSSSLDPTAAPNNPPGTRTVRIFNFDLPHNTESYDRITENGFVATQNRDVSTFSIDVDTASYANVRRFLQQDRCLPPPDAIRIEELINYFSYDYAPPAADSPHPFAAHVELTACPWNTKHRLARIGLKGKVVATGERGNANLVFLLDVSGSMESPNKLPLLKQSMKLLVDNLSENDRVAIVVYAGASGLVLPSTAAGASREILDALERLNAGGSTNGGAGIELAYDIARQNFVKGGVNRVILCTDGDFNVGVTSEGDLTRLIEEKAKTGVYLSVLGFGSGNLKDSAMEALSNKGNGNYAYIDSLREARKALVEEMGGTLVTIAKDVKIQVYFNPEQVAGWRLVGYENRLLAAQDFNDDKKDAGEIGSGHTVTALYEIVPAGQPLPNVAKVDPSPFKPAEGQKGMGAGKGQIDRGLLQLRLRYKQPDGDTSVLMESIVEDSDSTFDSASADLRFAAAVASFAQILRGSLYVTGLGLGAVEEIASGALGADKGGYRAEFVDLCRAARAIPRR